MCGVVGLIGARNASREAFLGLTTLQHRGQDAAGILTYDSEGFHRVRNLGLVESVFNRENMETLTGNLALGHARYSTIGRGDIIDVQPFLMSFPYGLAMVHNGNVVNTAELASELETKGRRKLLTQSDTEILLNLFSEGLAKPTPGNELNFDHICSAVESIMSKVKGSFSVIAMIADHGLVAFRDPYGLRPLIFGEREQNRKDDLEERWDGWTASKAYMVSSESVALSFNGYTPVRDLAPGECIFIDLKGEVHSKIFKGGEKRHCMFEWVYFASPESEIDKTPVYGSRIALGKTLAQIIKKRFQKDGLSADIVVPVPETSRIASIALSEELGIPYREVLIKNRYIKRTFILDSQDKRKQAVGLKLSPVRSELQGKKVILVDDSIVRGTTSRKIIELVRKAGASQVFFVSTCPPIRFPCYYGIDFPSGEELIAFEKDNLTIEKELGADAVIYQDEKGLVDAIHKAGTENFKPCMACLTGEYPGDVSAGGQFAKTRKQDRDQAIRRVK